MDAEPPNTLPSADPGAPAFLAGGGEMGELMRGHDWSVSALGPPARWPQALRTVVRLMLNTGHPMYVMWGRDGAGLYNDAFSHSIGPERHPSSLGRPAREVWSEIWDLIGPELEQVRTGGGATWDVDRLVPITRNGRREDVYWTYSYSPIDDDQAPGGIGGVLVLCTETTRNVLEVRRLAGAALTESEARFRTALIAGRMGSWETDYRGMTRTWTEEGMALFGIDLPGGRGRVGGPDDEYVAAMHPDDRHLAAHYRALADRQDSFAADYRIVRPDGSLLWLSGRGLVVAREADGRAHRLVSIMADATERKQAEERLRIEHERLGMALSAGRMGAYDMRLSDGVLWWSAQTYELFGVDPATFVPTPESVLELLHPEDRAGFVRGRAEAIAAKRPFVHEFRRPLPDGRLAWLGHLGQVEYDSDGSPLRSFGITMDITERRQAEQQLRESDRNKDRFIAMLAHELRNPLAPIRNASQVLRLKGAADPTAAWCHDVIDRQVVQMARLLDDLLDASRLSRGQLRLQLQTVDLATAIAHAVEIARPLIDAAGHSFSEHPPREQMHVQADLTRLAQVFSNVLINAAKYTPPRGAIALEVQRIGEQALISVTDNGIGLEAGQLARIFEMFGQVDAGANQSLGGQGIGLALSRGLVEMHGGTIDAHSEGLGRGSRFEIRLPLLPAEESGEQPRDASQSALQLQDGLRILIADDLKDAADSLALALRAMGHTVEVAYDGEQAVRLAGRLRPEAALLDLGMPLVDGCEACRRILAIAGEPRPLMIAQTGWGQPQDRERTRAAGFDHHLTKPVELTVLATLLPRR